MHVCAAVLRETCVEDARTLTRTCADGVRELDHRQNRRSPPPLGARDFLAKIATFTLERVFFGTFLGLGRRRMCVRVN